MKDNRKIILAMIITFLMSSLVSVAASGHLFDSNEVVYDNTNSGMSSTNVKGAVDELYAQATNYSSLNNRVTTLEGHLLNNNTIQKIHAVELNEDGTLSSFGGYIDFHFKGSADDYTTRIIETSSGELNISNPSNTATVKINGTDYTKASCTTKSSTSSNYTTAKLTVCRLGKIVQVFFEGSINYNNIPTGNNQSTNIFTGLPKSVTHVPLSLQIHSNAAPSQFGHVVFGVSPTGNLYINPGALPSNPGNYYTIFGGTYITTE